MTRKILLMILFLYSASSVAGKVIIEVGNQSVKTHLWIIKQCGKYVAFVFNQGLNTRVVAVKGMTDKQKIAVNRKIALLKVVNGKRQVRTMPLPCNKKKEKKLTGTYYYVGM